MATITSASAVFMLSIQSVYPVPQQLQGFGTDDGFLTDLVDAAEVQVGVDSVGVAGWIPRTPKQTIRLLASSLSFYVFENWIAAQDAIQDILYASATIAMPSISRKYTCNQGALMRVSTMADAKKVLANREFEITWMPPALGIPAITSGPMF